MIDGFAGISYADAIDALTGLWVEYDKCPYDIGTPEIDPLHMTFLMDEGIKGRTVWQLDGRAAWDFIKMHILGGITDCY